MSSFNSGAEQAQSKDGDGDDVSLLCVRLVIMEKAMYFGALRAQIDLYHVPMTMVLLGLSVFIVYPPAQSRASSGICPFGS